MILRFIQEKFGTRAPDVEALKSRADTVRLVTALHHPEPAIREASAAALGQLGNPEAISALFNALTDAEWTVRRAGVRALGRVRVDWAGPPASTAAENNQIQVHGTESASSQTGEKYLARVAHSQQVTAALVHALQDEVWQVREAAAETLAAFDHRTEDRSLFESQTEALLASLGDERLTVRKASAGALASLGPSTLRSLSAALNDSDWSRQEGAAFALGLLGQSLQDASLQAEIVTILAPILSDPDPRLRLAAVRALGQIGQDLQAIEHRQQVVDSLAATLADQHGQVRESAARALGRIGDARVAKLLVELLEDPKKSVQDAAAQALDRLAKAQGIQTGPGRI